MKKSSIFKVVCLLSLFFFAGVTKAQTRQMEPFPAAELGQEIIIDKSDALWVPLWQTGELSRSKGQAILDAGGDPCSKPTCSNGVCCQTVYWWDFGTNNCHLVTTCWEDGNPKNVLLTFKQNIY